MLNLLKATTNQNHADLFLERYEQLMNWAMLLTDGNRQQAEDLVHDAFIQFFLGGADLSSVENLDGYLRVLLRNVHVSQVRRAARRPFRALSAVEYDSAEIGLRTVDPRTLMKVQDELRAICLYACERKESSKAGSVLILRFFHGYYTSEIARVLKISYQAVKDRLRLARSETKLYLENPERLEFIRRDPRPENPVSIGLGLSLEDFLFQLRAAIFKSRTGACLLIERLESIYRKPEEAGPNVRMLSHIVSCRNCLDYINKLLCLPLLADRSPTDTMGRDEKKKGDDGPNGAGAGKDLKGALLRRTKDVFNHDPQELFITANGYLIGSQKVSSEWMDQTLTMQIPEILSFIEVFSEQEIRLLLMNVKPLPEGAIEQSATMRLSEGRTLDLSLNFGGPWPCLHIVYHDPTLQVANGKMQMTDDEESAADIVAVPLREKFIDFIHSFLFRPGTITALISLIIVAALILSRSTAPSVSAAELLRRAATAEESLREMTDQVVRRSLTLAERNAANGRLISLHRIEIWKNARQMRARRVYNERGVLVAGEWRKPDAARLVYKQGSKISPQIAAAAFSSEDMWQLEPEATAFTTLIGSADRASVEVQSAAYVIRYEAPPESRSQIVKASLVLNKSDMHSSEQTLLVSQGGELHEYKFIETSFERRPLSATAPAVFEPDPELLKGSPAGAVKEKGETSVAPRPATSLVVVASPALEVEVLEKLNNARALLGEQLSLVRTREGALKVEGIVETDERKREIVRALVSVRRDAAVKIEIETVAEADKREDLRRKGERGRQPQMTVQGIEVSSQTGMPIDADLRRYLSAQNSRRTETPEAMDQEVSRYSNNIFDRSIQARLHTLALKQIAERFSPADLQTLDPAAKSKWRAMLIDHARIYRSEIGRVRRDLEQIVQEVATDGPAETIELAGDADLARAAKRLFEFASATDEAIRQSFSHSTRSPGMASVKTGRFWQAIKGAEDQAAKIMIYLQ